MASPDALLGQALDLQFTTSNFNGYAVSCFGAKDGSIDLTVTGGTPPYSFEWSTGASTEDVSGLPAGYYRVAVYDSNSGIAEGELTLEEPGALKPSAEAFEYPNEYNVSCHSCYNGMIDVSAFGGVAPYTYLWKDGSMVEDRTGLGARDYTVTVSDANECSAEPITLTLREPERNDWTMTGNTGTNPSWQYLGTADNKDLVFRTNGQQRLRLTSAGEIKVDALSFNEGYKLVMVDSTGSLKLLNSNALLADLDDETKTGCPQWDTWPWTMCGNQVLSENFIGSINNEDLRFKTNNELRVVIDTEGKVGIGSAPPAGAITQYRLFVDDGIQTRDVRVHAGPFWPDFVFEPDYGLLSFDELRLHLQELRHLPGIPSAAELEEKGGVELGDMQRRLLQVVEEQALYILQLEERLRALEQRTDALETSR
ncbi:MAG: SprB repeat-containing protein [Flavobacteriales bacterium]|nr:SprB repeat-containing protein [Flavobacteriales bacterium]